MSQQTQAGLSAPELAIGACGPDCIAPGIAVAAAWAGSGCPPAPKAWCGPPFGPSLARGVDQLAFAYTFKAWLLRRNWLGAARFAASFTVGVDQLAERRAS